LHSDLVAMLLYALQDKRVLITHAGLSL